MLELKNVGKKLGGKYVARNVSFSVDKGEVLGVIGSNGAGKSTCISIIATLMKPDEGTVLYDGIDIAASPDTIRRVTGFVPQDIALYENLSGLENLKFWGKSYGVAAKALPTEIERVAGIIGFDRETLNKRVATYSGGMKRRLNIGVALLHRPELLLLDEPTTGIDMQSADQILSAIEELKKAGMAVIYVGHYMEEVERISTKLCIMDKGEVKALGDAKELLAGHESLSQLYKELCIERECCCGTI